MNLLDSIKHDDILNIIKKVSQNEIYLVGGAIRDYLSSNKTFDRDLIVCNEDAKIFSERLASTLDATLVSLDEINKIYRLVLKDKLNYIDITNPIDNSIEKDLYRRDFTINAIAINIRDYKIIDLFNGIEDYENHKIKLISEQNMYDDPLRMLRAFRFCSTLGFDLDKKILEFTDTNHKLIKKCAKERIIQELMKLFSGQNSHNALIKMDKLLEEIFPVVKELKQVPPNAHHHLDLFNHSIETVKQISYLYQNSSVEIKNHLDSIDFGGFSRLAHLKLAGFLHDIGKFSTWQIIDGKHRFIKHDDIGAKMSAKILKDMSFSNKQIEYVSLMIKNHMYPSSVISSPELNEKIMMRFVRKMEDNAIDNIIIAMADRLSARGPEITEEIVDNNIRGLSELLDFYLDKKSTLTPLPKLLDGKEIMQILNISQSPKLGKIINELKEAQISGDVTTKNDAINFINKWRN